MLDLSDLRILSQVEIDAKQSYSEIGKKIKRSKQFVKYRLERLENSGIIKKYIADTAVREAGYTLFNILLQFQKTSREKEARIMNYLKKSKDIGYVLCTLGNWDIFLSVKAREITDFYNFLRELHKVCSDSIKKEVVNLETRGTNTNLKFIANDKEPKYISINTTSSKKDDLNEFERKIFEKIRENPLASCLDISLELKKSYNTISKKISELKKRGVLKRVRAIVDTEKLGYERYLFLMELRFLSKEGTENLLRYLTNHKNIDYVIECIGSWSMICNVYSKNNQELLETINQIKENFGKNISSIEFLRVIENEKETFNTS